MPRGTPLRLAESVVLFSSFTGLTKLMTTRFTDGWPLPRSISQWFLTSKSVMSRTADQLQPSLLHSQAPYTEMGFPARQATAAAARPTTTRTHRIGRISFHSMGELQYYLPAPMERTSTSRKCDTI